MLEGNILNKKIGLTEKLQIIPHAIIIKFLEIWGICHHLSICN